MTGCLHSLCFVVVPRIATVDNKAVSMMLVPFSFFSIFFNLPELHFAFLHGDKQPRETKFEYQLFCKAHV